MWALGLTFFPVAVAMEFAHSLAGWTPLTYRFWYLCGAVYSAWQLWKRRMPARRMWANLLIALGAFTIAGTGTLNRIGVPGFQTLGVLLAVSLLFMGFLWAGAADRPREPQRLAK